MAKLSNIYNGGITVNITNTDLFHDIIDLLKEEAESNPSISHKLAEIMTKHSTEYDYFIEEE